MSRCWGRSDLQYGHKPLLGLFIEKSQLKHNCLTVHNPCLKTMVFYFHEIETKKMSENNSVGEAST